MKKLLIILCLILIPGLAWGATYYMRADGTAANKAAATGPCSVVANCMSIATHDADTYSADDIIVVCDDGGTYRDQMDIPSSGTSGHPITYQAESGGSPVISGANLVTTWGDEGDNVWSATVTTQPEVVTFDGHYGYRQAVVGSVNSEYDWYWASNVLYVYSTSDPDTAYVSPGIEAANRAFAIVINGKSYITVDGITFSTNNEHAVNVSGNSSYLTFTNCIFENSSNQNFNSDIGGTQSNITIEDCTSRRGGNWGVVLYGQDNWTIRRLTSYRDGIIHSDFSGGVWGGGIVVNGTEAVPENNVIESCEVSYAGIRDDGYKPETTKGKGIWLDTVYATVGNENIIRYNSTHHNASSGLFAEKTHYSLWYYNISYSNDQYGLRVGTDSAFTCENNGFYNNTLYGNDTGIFCYNDLGTNNGAINNIFKNNIAVGNTTRQATFKDGFHNDGTDGSGNVYTYNCFGAESANFIEWAEGVYKSTYDAWETSYGGSTYSVEADPLFADASGGNFQLTAPSPCRNKGISVGLTEDYDGKPVPRGAFPEIGAYEWMAEGSPGQIYIGSFGLF